MLGASLFPRWGSCVLWLCLCSRLWIWHPTHLLSCHDRREEEIQGISLCGQHPYQNPASCENNMLTKHYLILLSSFSCMLLCGLKYWLSKKPQIAISKTKNTFTVWIPSLRTYANGSGRCLPMWAKGSLSQRSVWLALKHTLLSLPQTAVCRWIQTSTCKKSK